MTRSMRGGALSLACAVLAACSAGEAHVRYTVLTSVDQLQEAFNVAEGKIRAVFLASPT